MRAYNNIEPEIREKCAVVQSGECICGRAAESGELLFAKKTDERHTKNISGMQLYGQYCIPMNVNGETIGVMNIYTEEGQGKDEKEAEFLAVVSGSLAQIIMRKRGEDAIRKLSSAVEQAADHIIITDKDGNIEYVNKAFEDLTGFTEEDWISRTPRILKSGLHEDSVYKAIWEKILSGRSHLGITINKKKNGELYYEEKTITPLKDKDGNITHFVSTGRDITERIKAEDELRLAKEKAERSERLKSDFLAQMSHEIRTPINSILNFTSLLRFETEDKVSEEFRPVFSYIESGGRRLIRTIDLILNMSQLQAGSYEVNPVKIDLSKEILDEVIMELLPSAKEKNLELVFHKKASTAVITGDNYTVGQIFTNLIDNAIKFTESGKVEVILDKDKDSEEIRIEVNDTGIGISKEYLPQLFNPFSQEETGYTRRFEGNGLGLALVKKYIELNDAYIKVETEKGVGSRFIVGFKQNLKLI
ncbi:MAG: ATP-binding protein [Bacillota bacterium]